MKRVHIATDIDQPPWTDDVLPGLLAGLNDPHCVVQCGPVAVNALLGKGPDITMARIALADVVFAYFAVGSPRFNDMLFQLGFAAALEKPIYIGAMYPPPFPSCAVATEVFSGDPVACWGQFLKALEA